VTELALHLWVIATAVLCAVGCSSVGTFLVLRRESLLGDAISHAVLPGIAIAFLLSGSREILPMFLGATACGLLTAVLTQFLQEKLNLERGAALGVVFTTLFAIGIIIIRQAADSLDLDPGCVLYGLIEFVPLDTITILGFEIPRATRNLFVVVVVNFLFISLFYKELLAASFDEEFSHVSGLRPKLIHYALVSLVALTTVVSFEAVGSVLVVALIIIPAAIARFWSDRLISTLILASVFAGLSGVVGYGIALNLNTSVSGAVSAFLGLLFILSLLFAKKHGLMSRYILTLQHKLKLASGDALGLLFRAEEGSLPSPFRYSERNIVSATAAHSGVPRLLVAFAVRKLLLSKQLERVTDGTLNLTEKGRKEAEELVRSHRLWEQYLVERLGLKPDHVHQTATMMEHYTDEEMQKRLEKVVSEKKKDPHGREIPS